MKKIFLLALPFCLSLVVINGCKEYKKIEMAQTHQFEDNIVKIVPGVRSIQTFQDDDYTKVKIILDCPGFYGASDAEKSAAAVKVGQMVLQVLGPDNNISNGTLVLTKDNSQRTTNPADAINVDMKLDSLKKVGGK